MRTPPTLVSLAIDSALNNFAHISDISFLPQHILPELFLRTLKAGKLNEKILKLFAATGKEEIISVIDALNIQHIPVPVLPNRCSGSPCAAISASQTLALIRKTNPLSFRFLLVIEIMSQISITDDEVDIVVGALQPDLTSFMEEWSPIFSRFHLIIVKDPELKEDLKIPDGFNVDLYTKPDIDRVVGSSSSAISFSGYSCRYFGYLMSRKKYVICIDDDCIPARDSNGYIIDAVSQHITNLAAPATPFFFNTLYDPFREGTDFVRGYPFSLRNGVDCGLSCGLWLNLADYDAPTQVLKPDMRNVRYVDAVLTIPSRTMMPVSGINIGVNSELVGPAMLPAFRLVKEGKLRWETVEDIWSGMCVKVVCDHLRLGVKSGLPYVWRKERGDAIESLRKEWDGVKLMEDVVPFFQSVRLSQEAVTAEDCVAEIAASVKEKLGPVNPVFAHAADTMVVWIKIWKRVRGPSRVQQTQ